MSTESDRSHQKPPFLKRVRIRNYKSIRFCDVGLESLTVLVGRNGSGKSNFVDALGFLRHVVEHGAPTAVKMHGGWSAVCNRAADRAEVFLEVTLDPQGVRSPSAKIGPGLLPLWNGSAEKRIRSLGGLPVEVTYGVKIGGRSFEGAEVLEEYCYFEIVGSSRRFGYRRNPVSVNPYSSTTEDSGLLPGEMLGWFAAMQPDRPILSVLGVQPWLDVNEGLLRLATYSLVSSVMREHQPPEPGLMVHTGRNVSRAIVQLQEIDPDSINRVRQYLTVIVPGVTNFEPVTYGDRETVRFTVTLGGRETVFDASSMSDGTLRVFASLIAAFQIGLPTGPSLVALEEPETSLHPAAMRALVSALDEATGRTQILITTHSTELLDNKAIQPKNVRVVEMIDGETVIGTVDEASVEIVRRKLDSLGGLERQNQLEPDFDDVERQRRLAASKGDAA